MKSVTRIVLLLMTMLLVVSPSVSGQATPEAPVDEPTTVIDEVPDAADGEGTGDTQDETLPPADDEGDAAPGAVQTR